ncbi:MAG: hypothetical protein KDI75_03810, partial [Xanthomonadales bacterium]|nr:hypothetical protein [Xanthomonadales bacterium]
EAFCPPARRERLRLFGCLLSEWEDAILTPSDASVATGKLLWWAEELAAGGQHHPLARALVEQDVEVCALRVAPQAAARLVDADSAGDMVAAIERCRGFAMAAAAANAAVFGHSDADDRGDDFVIGLLRRAAINAAAGHPLARERLPLNLLARHAGDEGDTAKAAAFHRDFAGELLCIPDRRRLPLMRALRRAFDRHRLQSMARGKAEPDRESLIPPLRTLWLAWNAARRAHR